MEENRFLRCVAEYRAEQRGGFIPPNLAEDRFRRFVAEERHPPNRLGPDADSWRAARPVLTSPVTPTTPTTSNIIYYSPTKTNEPPRESFEERFARTVAAQRALNVPALPTSPLVVPRKRQDSSLSLMSEESFPSLPSTTKSTPTTPTLKVMGWSDALKKNMEECSIAEKRRQSRKSAHQWNEEEWEEGEGEIVYDEDGFPSIRHG